MLDTINQIGTTSACAENTVDTRVVCVKFGNYLRVRGEYCAMTPRGLIQRGTTSACAENTAVVFDLLKHDGNYLRVRGEYQS